MIKVMELGNQKRRKFYYKAICPHCESTLAFELGDVWIDEILGDGKDGCAVGRIECPSCRTKMLIPNISLDAVMAVAEPLEKAEYKSVMRRLPDRTGLQQLIDEKKVEDIQLAKEASAAKSKEAK